jgi:hypothetical protein
MKKSFKLGMLAMVLVFGFVVVGCATGPRGITTAPEDMQPTFFVSASGLDASDGRSEPAAFKTLTRAVAAAKSSSVRTITVIGTLIGLTTEITGGGPGEILITGTPNAPGVIIVSEGLVINITNSTVRFEHIALAGGDIGGISLKNQANVTLGSGVLLMKNSGAYGGLIIGAGCTATMQDNAEISGNEAYRGGGAAVFGTLIMKDNSVITENEATSGKDKDGKINRGDGGGVYVEDGKLIMQDNAVISDNKAFWGAGVYSWDGIVTMQDNAKITGNSIFRSMKEKYGGSGGGLYQEGEDAVFTISGHAAISENKAGYGAGIYVAEGKATLRDNASVSDNAIVYWTNPDDKTDIFGNNGGGVMISKDATFTMEGDSVISGNEAGAAGGGVWVANDVAAVFIQKGGSITGNSADSGGGVFLGVKATHTQTGGSITGNVGNFEGDDLYRNE